MADEGKRNVSLPHNLLNNNNSSSSSSSSNAALQGALLIKAQSRIVELEDQVCKLRQEAAVEGIKQDLATLASRNIGITNVERELKVSVLRGTPYHDCLVCSLHASLT